MRHRRWKTSVSSRIARAAAGAVILASLGAGSLRAAMLAPPTEPEPIRFAYFEDATLDDAIPHPREIVGHDIGERFTRHAQQTRYFEALARASDRVILRRYGHTHQRRPLHIATIGSPENLARLDRILADNRRLADPSLDEPEATRIIESNPAIVWLSYGVHGNETSPAEAAMMVAYTLAAGRGEPFDALLENVIVVIDPLLNPDGHERYVSWYQNVRGEEPSARHEAAEHDEPWPSGRTNHYLFDLNRDWVWLVHPESRSRVAVYREHLPQLHIDNHEQGFRSPYFFGLGDDPYNVNIPEETKRWVERYGEHNAEVFDRHGLVYATKERFDYLYPGYGKVLPVYHGAVGMLTEQAGHGFAGLAVEVSEHYTLTLRERARNHYLTSMSYVETTARNRRAQLERFRRFFIQSVQRGREDPLTFFLSSDNDPALLEKARLLCARHGIEVRRLTDAADVAGLRSYRTGGPVDRARLPGGTWMIRTDQPMGRLARALFERHTEITDPDTYDITSWSVPVSFGLRAWYTDRPVDAPTEPVAETANPEGRATGEGDYALLIDARRHAYPAAVGRAVEHDLFVRHAGDELRIEGRRFGAGSMIVHTTRNRHADLEKFVEDVRALGLDVHRVATGMTDEGPVLGTNENAPMDLPEVAIVRGSPTSSYSFGQHWHLLDIERSVPHTVINADTLRRVDLDEYNVLVLPHGARFGGGTKDAIASWIREGGTLVATGSAATWADASLLELEAPKDPEDLPERPEPSELTYEQRRERGVEDRVPGATLRVIVDTTHPLAAGVPEWLGVIKRGDRRLRLGDRGHVIAHYDEDQPRIAGVISERNQQRLAGTPFMTMHRMGRGQVISIADDVTMRGFMHGPMRLLLNAITLGPSM